MFLLIISVLVLPVRSQVVVPAYDWIEVGAFARYTTTPAPDGLIFPNGTIVRLWHIERLSPPAVLEWTIISKVDTSVRLNITFILSTQTLTHQVTLVLEVDMHTRDSFIDGEPIGKTCFWAEPYGEPGEKIVLYGLPPDQIIGNVTNVLTVHPLGEEVRVYLVDVFQLDPFAMFTPRFNWYTGMAEVIVLVGSYPLEPKGEYTYTFPNGTEYIIKRFASTPLGEKLCLYQGGTGYYLGLNSTNVRLGPKPEEDGAPDIADVWRYYPYVFLAALAVSAGAFILIRRKRPREGSP